MSADDDPRCRAMVEFLGTFPTVSSPIENFSNLADGVAIFEALSEIAPAYFDPTTIARHLGDNWVLKSSNLRKLIRNLESYYHEGLKKDADVFSTMDLQRIAREGDVVSMQDLVELVAAAAVTCEAKGEYVSRIMGMSSESQVEIKGILESSLSRLSDYQPDYYDDEDQEGDENEMVFGQHDEGSVRMDEDDNAVNTNLFGSDHLKSIATSDLEEQLMDARREVAALKSQAAMAVEDSEKAQNKLRALVEDLQDRLVQRQDDLVQLEDDLKRITSELEETKSKLTEVKQQKAQLADDLDVANAKAQQLHRAEATVVAYKKKLDSVGVMNQQMTDLEDQAANYLRQIMELENEVKKSAALQKTVTDLQEQVARLEKEKSNNVSSTMSASTEIADLRSQLLAAEKSKKMYESELSELRAQQESSTSGDVPVASMDALSISPAQSNEQREKVMRLEIENKNLQDEVSKLQNEMEAIKTSAVAATAAATATFTAASIGTDDTATMKAEINRLTAELAAKDKENAKISSDKDKLEAYTKRTLAKFQDKYLVALQECKAKLKEKQDKIEILESRSASERTAQKREERLLSSTIYELGLGIMQNRLKSGSSASKAS